MKLVFDSCPAFLVNVNPRSELHGEERKPAGDVTLRVNVPNKMLDTFHETLKHALFFHDTENPKNDLADKAMEGRPDHIPHLRFNALGLPLKWNDQMFGATLTIHRGGGDIVLPDVRVNKVEFTPKAGGTVELEFRVQGHPDEAAFGRLCGSGIIQTEVLMSLKPDTHKPPEQGTLPGTEPGAQAQLSGAATS